MAALSDFGDCLDIYWWLRYRVVEIPVLELIAWYAAPEGCPILYFFAGVDHIPLALYADHGATPPWDEYTESPWDVGPPDPGPDLIYFNGAPYDIAAAPFDFFGRIDSDDDGDGSASHDEPMFDDADDAGTALSNDPIEDA